jgi:hypothetical protein
MGQMVPGRGHRRSKVALMQAGQTWAEAVTAVGGGGGRRWRKLSETKWWACGDCWPCGENLGLRYEIKCSLVRPYTFVSNQ